MDSEAFSRSECLNHQLHIDGRVVDDGAVNTVNNNFGLMNCSDNAFSLRLQALSCPFTPAPDLSDALDLQKLIAWLEDTHIRRLPIPQRTSLYLTDFLPGLHHYLHELEAPTSIMPITADGDSADVDGTYADVNRLRRTAGWLVDLALTLHYSDKASFYNEPVDPWEGRCVPVIEGASKDPQVAKAVERLSQTVGIDTSSLEDPSDGVSVVADIAEFLVQQKESGTPVDVSSLPSLEDIPLGFKTGEPAVDRAATVMRLLHVRQLRALQNDINDLIGDMQALTANPKTNSKLGKVGR